MNCSNTKKIAIGTAQVEKNAYNEQEWKKSSTISLNDSIQVQFQQDEKNIYIGIDFMQADEGEYRWVELFTEYEGILLRLHASGQLGEQLYNGIDWTEEWDWGNNEKWLANKHGMNTKENRAYVFSLEKERFGTKKMSLMLSVFSIQKTADFSTPPNITNFPEIANNKESTSWFSIKY